MFEGFKEKIYSVVQDGLNVNSNLKQTLTEVQKVKKNLFRDKTAPSSIDVNLDAGSCILDKYQKEWFEIHKTAEENASAAEEVDNLIMEINNKTNAHLLHASDLCASLATLPRLCETMNECVDTLKGLQSLILTVEKVLCDFEILVENDKLARSKIEQHYQLGLYQEKKLADLEVIRSRLAIDSANTNSLREKRRLLQMREKQAICEENFCSDINAFKATGALPEKIEKLTKSMSRDLTLEQIHLEPENPDELDIFLNS